MEITRDEIITKAAQTYNYMQDEEWWQGKKIPEAMVAVMRLVAFLLPDESPVNLSLEVALTAAKIKEN